MKQSIHSIGIIVLVALSTLLSAVCCPAQLSISVAKAWLVGTSHAMSASSSDFVNEISNGDALSEALVNQRYPFSLHELDYSYYTLTVRYQPNKELYKYLTSLSACSMSTTSNPGLIAIPEDTTTNYSASLEVRSFQFGLEYELLRPSTSLSIQVRGTLLATMLSGSNSVSQGWHGRAAYSFSQTGRLGFTLGCGVQFNIPKTDFFVSANLDYSNINFLGKSYLPGSRVVFMPELNDAANPALHDDTSRTIAWTSFSISVGVQL